MSKNLSDKLKKDESDPTGSIYNKLIDKMLINIYLLIVIFAF